MNPLALDPEDMRAMGHRTVDLLVELLEAGRPAIRRAGAAEMAARVPFGLPEEPQDFHALLARLERDVLPFMSNSSHPGYMAFVPACGTFPAALGDLIAAALGVYVGSWMEGAGASRLELVVLDWFKDWIGYPSAAAGVLVPGGSAANLTALACARETLHGPTDDRAVLYVADQSHASVARAIRVLGFRPDQTHVLPTDAGQRLQPASVAAAIDADLAAGLRPLAVVAAAGATNTGAIDPLGGLAAVCRERGVWLHVDAAYGGFAALTERGRRDLAGLELADSVTLDPHKWLYQPIECGCALVRDGHLLQRAFEIEQDYTQDAAGRGDEVNFGDLGLQLTRGFRALKVWLSISHFGVAAFRDSIDKALDLAELARRRIRADDRLEPIAAGELGITCFRRRVAGGEEEAASVNAALIDAYEASGRGLVLSTRVGGRYAVRLCVLNHTTCAEDVEAALDFFASAPVGPADGDGMRSSPHMMDVGAGWLRPAGR